MKPILSIIIPTYSNPHYLNPCVASIYRSGILNKFAELIVVNNGDQPIEPVSDAMRVLKPGKNTGWEGGLKLGLEKSEAKFVVFQNDDTFIPQVSWTVYDRLLMPFQNKKVAAVGPATTTAAGCQSIYAYNSPVGYVDVRWLIFFTVMVRRSALEEVGGIDASLPGGDDFDLSIRLRKAGYGLVVAPDAFLIHEGFKTGERVRGGPGTPGGWNSKEMTEATNRALIQKHGFKTFFEAISGQIIGSTQSEDHSIETDLIRGFADGCEKVLELGCGSRKFVPHSVGVDITPNGENCKDHEERVSVADVVADVTKEMPFEPESFDAIVASHILEHCIDPLETVLLWRSYLKPGGRLIIAVPNEEVTKGIPLNPEHCHAYTQESLKNMMALLKMTCVGSEDSKNGISLVACFEKEGSPHTNGVLKELASA